MFGIYILVTGKHPAQQLKVFPAFIGIYTEFGSVYYA
jgi:hypothetical protein